MLHALSWFYAYLGNYLRQQEAFLATVSNTLSKGSHAKQNVEIVADNIMRDSLYGS